MMNSDAKPKERQSLLNSLVVCFRRAMARFSNLAAFDHVAVREWLAERMG